MLKSPTRSHRFFPLLVAPLGAFLSGLILGEWNILVEVIRGKSIFSYKDMIKISLWHGLIWTVVGIMVGVIWCLFYQKKYFSLRKNFFTSFLVFSYFAAWLLIQGYLNIYIFAGIFHLKSIVINAGIFVLGLIGLISLIKWLKTTSFRFNKFWTAFFFFHGILFLIGLILLIFPGKGPASPHFLMSKSSKATNLHKNVILIIWDAVRADHLSCYGYPKKTTPHLDDLASQGILFERAFAPSSHTVESIPSILSSTLPTSHQVNDVTACLPSELVLLPQIFKALGYQTAAFSFNPYVSPSYGYKKGFNRFFAPSELFIKTHKTVFGHLLERSSRLPWLFLFTKPLYNLSEKITTISFGETSLHSIEPRHLTQRIISWIKHHPKKPFFVYAHFEGGHSPYLASPTSIQKFWPGEKLPEEIDELPTTPPESLGLFLPFHIGPPLDQKNLEKMLALYDAKIHDHDFYLGQLINFLKIEGLWKNTLLIITADHGEEFYDHQGWGHGHSLYQEVIHVPLVISDAGILPRGVRVKSPVSLLDLMPTLLSLLNLKSRLEFPYSLEGIDLKGIITHSYLSSREDPIYAELTQGNHKAYALIDDHWKIIKTIFDGEECVFLYDLNQDPDEKNDLASLFPQKKQELLSRLESIIAKAQKKGFESRRRRIDKREKEKLRALGYIR